MKSKKVNYEIAKKLVNKGIIIPCTSNCWVKTLDGEIIHNDERKNIPEHDRCSFYIGQPYLMDVKDKLEEMGYYIVLWTNAIEKKYRYEITYTEDKSFYLESFNEYEYYEGLSEGILELLKHI